MLFNINFHLDAEDEVEAAELVTHWKVTPGAKLEHIWSVDPINVDPKKLPVVDEEGNIDHPPHLEHPIVLPPENGDGEVPPDEVPPSEDDLEPTHPIVEPEPIPPAVAAFTFSPEAPRTNALVTFDGTTSLGAGTISYAWEFEGGQGGNFGVGPVITHSWDKRGSREASLTITDEAGQTDQMIQTVTIT